MPLFDVVRRLAHAGKHVLIQGRQRSPRQVRLGGCVIKHGAVLPCWHGAVHFDLPAIIPAGRTTVCSFPPRAALLQVLFIVRLGFWCTSAPFRSPCGRLSSRCPPINQVIGSRCTRRPSMAQQDAVDIHATGAPDTPVEVITDLLERALKADDLQEVKKLVQQSYDVAGGLDPYMDKISTPPSKVCTNAGYQPSIPQLMISATQTRAYSHFQLICAIVRADCPGSDSQNDRARLEGRS